MFDVAGEQGCDLSPCVNGATCVPKESGTRKYECACVAGESAPPGVSNFLNGRGVGAALSDPSATAHHAQLLPHSAPCASTCLGFEPICNHGGTHTLQCEHTYALLPHCLVWVKSNVVRCDLGMHVRWRTRCGPGVTKAVFFFTLLGVPTFV